MRKNYLASAGTGKTYRLVEEIIENYIKKGVNINQLFISTFTEKAGAELKRRIYERLKEEIYKEKTENLQNNFNEVQNSYIGTLHSLLLRILKNHPDISKITDETKIIEGIEFEGLFIDVFDEFVIEEKEKIDEITEFLGEKSDIRKIFREFYENRWKLNSCEMKNTDSNRLEIEKLKDECLKDIKEMIQDFYKEAVEFSRTKQDIMKTDIFGIKRKLEEGLFIDLKFEKNKRFPRFLKTRVKPEYEKEFKKIKENLENRKNEIEPVENNLIQNLEKIRNLALYQNFLLILKHYKKFEEKLEKIKEQENVLNYDDIFIRALHIFKNFPEIKQKYIKKFKAIFIDEFQDTDLLQLKVIKILSEKSDLIVFGDPKQCIYEWRHASLEDYLKFINKNFKKEENINLDICFRSNIDLIGFFNLSFCKDGYDFLNRGFENGHIDDIFLPKLSFPDFKKQDTSEFPVSVLRGESKDKEPYLLVETINSLIEEGYQPRDILVLFRTTNGATNYLKQLKISNIPFISFLESEFYKSYEVLTVLNILRLVQYPDDKLNLISVLKSPLFNFSDEDLFLFKDDFSLENIDQLKFLKDLSEKKDSKGLYRIVSEIFENLPVFEVFSVFPDGKQKLANLQKLKDYSQRLERENFNLRDFINLIEENRDTREEEGLLIEDDNFVRIMTMHKAKGLEGKIVIIPDLSRKKNPRNAGFYTVKGRLMVKIISDNGKTIAQSKNFDEELVKELKEKENRRILYVALTRAKERLIFIGSKKTGLMKDIENLLNFVKGKETVVGIKDTKTGKIVGEKKIKIKIGGNSKEINLKNKKYWEELKEKKIPQELKEELDKIRDKEENWREEFEKSISSKRFTTVSELVGKENEKSKIEEEQIKEIEENFKQYKDKSIQLGILIHKILEEFSFETDSKKAEEELFLLLEKNIANVSEELRSDIEKDARKILKNFLKSDDYKEISTSQILFKEMPFTLKEKNRYIEGVIDIVYKKDGKIIVLDYKITREKNIKRIEEIYKKQKEYYTKAVKNIFPEEKIEFKFSLLHV